MADVGLDARRAGAAVWVLALIGHALLYRILGRIARRSATPVDNALVDRTCGPTRLLFPLLAFSASLDEITHSVPRL